MSCCFLANLWQSSLWRKFLSSNGVVWQELEITIPSAPLLNSWHPASTDGGFRPPSICLRRKVPWRECSCPRPTDKQWVMSRRKKNCLWAPGGWYLTGRFTRNQDASISPQGWCIGCWVLRSAWTDAQLGLDSVLRGRQGEAVIWDTLPLLLCAYFHPNPHVTLAFWHKERCLNSSPAPSSSSGCSCEVVGEGSQYTHGGSPDLHPHSSDPALHSECKGHR